MDPSSSTRSMGILFDLLEEITDGFSDDRKLGIGVFEEVYMKGSIMDPSSSTRPMGMPFHLLEEITDRFSDDRKLGTGTFGEVYMGILDNGEKIAVKRLRFIPGLDDKQFLKEFDNLARLDHENIVRLVNYCSENREEYVEHEGKNIVVERIHRALCLEYMPNGSLAKYISDDGDLLIDWNTCYRIFKGICKGVQYLHESKPAIYHLDLKPDNILLDENMQPKIADFGLSRFLGEEKTWITETFVGTMGYMPPEFIRKQEISNKFDIFSLGVVYIKIVTGRKGYSRSTEMPAKKFVEFAYKHWMIRLQATPKYLFESNSKQFKRCMEIALRCVEEDRSKRPLIGEIVEQLDETETAQAIALAKWQGLGAYATKEKILVGKYELGRIIGVGTFAKVRLARDIVTGESVAIKILDKEKVLKHKMVEQIEREISMMKLIKHPNVVRIYEVMGSKTNVYIVLEFASGGELFDAIVNHGRMREDEARRYFQQLVNAVDYCHSRGVYLRNLKPENLLLDSYGNLKVSGFGLSTLSQQIKDDGLLHTTCGIPNYVAPEVLEDQGYDGAMADLWSCGVILFVLLAGYFPFDDYNLMALYKKISNAELTFPPWTSFPAKRLLTRILDPNPMTRITIPEILEDEWFKKGYKLPEFDEIYDITLDDVDAIFNDSEEHHVTEKKEEEPVALNAFELISMSAGLNLGNFVDSEQELKRETRFTSKCPPKEIVCKIEEAAKPLGFDVQKKNYKLRLEKVNTGRKGNLNVAIEILQVAPSLHLVEVRKAKGDTLEFHKFYKKLSSTLKDVVWKSDDLQTQHAS